MPLLLVYITTSSAEAAEKLGRTLVEEKLAACANVLPTTTSIYHWQGLIETASESVLLLKTTRERYEMLEARVKTLHEYQMPCVVALPLAEAEPVFAQWIREQVEELKSVT